MRVGFAGTPAFAATALEAIVAAGHEVSLVLTRPDRPRGRGLRLTPGEVGALAARLGLRVEQPATLREPTIALRAVELDVLVVTAYGSILPRTLLDWPRLGCLNIHASLLPRWRGAAPIQRAILAGDTETGISIMQMDEGLDTGPVAASHLVRIAALDTAGSLQDRLAALGARAIVETLAAIEATGAVVTTPQDETRATYAAKIDAGDAVIDWERSAGDIDRQVRALEPVPGARTSLDGQPLKIRRARPLEAGGAAADAGRILHVDANGMAVACGAGVLQVLEVQPAGGRRMEVAAFVTGRRIAAGLRLGAD